VLLVFLAQWCFAWRKDKYQKFPEVAQPVQQVQPVAQNVQSVPEINVAPVQQVPTLDLSAINTNVTLPTDMTANPTPNNGQQGVFGPASLDAQSDMAA
jgi:hypothetical protein